MRDVGVKMYCGQEAVQAFDPPLDGLEEAERLDEIAAIFRQQNELATAALWAWVEWLRRECKPARERNDNRT